MRDWKDRLGIFVSAACAVHCAATPILLAALPTLKITEWMANPIVHPIVAVVCCALVALAILPGAVRWRDLRLLSLTSAGLGLILTAAFAMPEPCCVPDASKPLAHADRTANAHVLSSGTLQDHSHHNHTHHDHAHAEAASTSSESSGQPIVVMAGMGQLQPWMTPLGGVLLMMAHGLNISRRRRSVCSRSGCRADHAACLAATELPRGEPSPELV